MTISEPVRRYLSYRRVAKAQASLRIRLRRVCASAQSRQSLRYSRLQRLDIDEDLDQTLHL